jgi:ankyrin repeat protein
VKLLIANGADVNKYCIDEVSPLLLATVLNEIEIVKILIQNGSDINFKTSDLNISIYDIANSYDDQRIVDLLELEGVEITETKEIDSFISVIKELYKETKKEKLITHDKESLQNIEKDMILKKEKLEQELNNSYEKQLEHYLDIEVKHILNEAVELKTEEKFQLLINAGFNFENIDINILFRDSFPTNFIKEVIRQSTNVNITDENGMAPIMYACQLNSIELVNLLLQKGADKNIKNNNGKRAKDFTNNKEIRELLLNYIFKTHNPQKLVKLLTNFTIDKPIKYTTHTWDFGELKKEYGNFDGYMNAVKNQFDTMKYELEELSLNLYKKIYTFLIEITPNENYSWCSKTNINIGWSSLDGLKEWCDSGKNPFDFKLQKPILIPPRKQISTFGEIINLFKQEIEIRSDFKNLETIFNFQKNKLDSDFKLDLSTSKLSRQFYTDTQRISFALDKIFAEIGKRKEFLNLEINSIELDDRSIEIAITQIDSTSNRSENELLERAKQSGDLADIVEILKNLCDYSIESSHENTHFRVNFLHSNNVRGIEILSEKPKGFSHILRFYK